MHADTRSNGTAHTTFQLHTPQSSLTKESPPQRPPSVQPIQQRSPTIQRSRPLGVMPAFFRSRPEEPIIPSSEWANTLPPTPVTRLPEERGRRPRPITPPSPSSAGTGIVPPNLLTDSSPDLSGRDIPPIPPTTPWADPVSMASVAFLSLVHLVPHATHARLLSRTTAFAACPQYCASITPYSRCTIPSKQTSRQHSTQTTSCANPILGAH